VRVTDITGDGNVVFAMKPGAVSNPYGNISTASVNDDNLVIYELFDPSDAIMNRQSPPIMKI